MTPDDRIARLEARVEALAAIVAGLPGVRTAASAGDAAEAPPTEASISARPAGPPAIAPAVAAPPTTAPTTAPAAAPPATTAPAAAPPATTAPAAAPPATTAPAAAPPAERAAPAAGDPSPTDAAGTFWALEGFRARTVAPGGVLFTGAVTLADDRHLEWQEAFPLSDLLAGFDDEAAAALAAVAHPVRLLLLRILLDGPRTVAELGEHERLGTSGQTYHHLRQLVGAGWLRTVARGRYGVPPERVVPLLTAIAAVRR